MKITVIAKPNKKQVKVEQISPGYYVVSVKEPPKEGRANLAIRDALSEYFNIPKTDILFLTGHTSKVKVFSIPDTASAVTTSNIQEILL